MTFHDRYRTQRGHWAWHVTPIANLTSIVQRGLDGSQRYSEMGIGGSRSGMIYLSTTPSGSDQWAQLRVSIDAIDPELVEPDDDAIGHLGFDEEFGDEADAVLDSWGYAEQGAWVAEQAEKLTADDNLAVLFAHGDFAYSGRIDPACIEVRVRDRWQRLSELHVPAEHVPLKNHAAEIAIRELVVHDLDGNLVTVEQMRDPGRSRGTCAAASRALQEALRAAGIDAHLVEGLDPYGSTGAPHAWVEADLGQADPWGSRDSRRVLIDLTAAQMGESAWPLVRAMQVDEQAIAQIAAELGARPELSRLDAAPSVAASDDAPAPDLAL